MFSKDAIKEEEWMDVRNKNKNKNKNRCGREENETEDLSTSGPL
jgi:hypothetical protein